MGSLLPFTLHRKLSKRSIQVHFPIPTTLELRAKDGDGAQRSGFKKCVSLDHIFFLEGDTSFMSFISYANVMSVLISLSAGNGWLSVLGISYKRKNRNRKSIRVLSGVSLKYEFSLQFPAL